VHKIVGGVRVKQPVLNMGEYVYHMMRLLKNLLMHNFVEVNYNCVVNSINVNDQNFSLMINHKKNMHFDTVINAGYAKGLEIPILEHKNEKNNEGNIVKLKVYGLYKIPPVLESKIRQYQEKFSSIILIRG
jgi:hypothetical protein